MPSLQQGVVEVDENDEFEFDAERLNFDVSVFCSSLSTNNFDFCPSVSGQSFDLSTFEAADAADLVAPTSSSPSTNAGAVVVKSVYVPCNFRFRLRFRSSLYLFHSATSGALYPAKEKRMTSLNGSFSSTLFRNRFNRRSYKQLNSFAK